MRFRLSGPRSLVLVIIAGLATFATPVFAQSTFVRLHGQVTDPSGAVIPGADISVKNSSGLLLTAKSDGAGAYEVRHLAPGKYTVSVSAKGFVPSIHEVEIAVDHETKLDIALEILAKEENVEVQSEGAKVSTDSDSNASSVVITGKDLDALSDDPDELQSELQALAGPSAGPNGGQIYIDGFTGGQLPPKSSIREIRINQNPFSAQYDRMGFGRVEILTKPGTDKVHGQFFFNDNHSVFDALNPFAASEPAFSSQMFNGNVGGPLSKRASYFVSFERRDIADAAVINPEAFISAGLPVIGVENPRVRNNMSSRLDFQITPGNTLMVRYQFVHDTQDNNGVGPLALPSQAFNQSTTENEIQISDTQVLSPRAVNETRFEWEHGNSRQNALNAGPSINVQGAFVAGANPIGISSAITDHFEVQNYTSYNVGRHFFRFGGRLRASKEDDNSLPNSNGTYLFTTVGAFRNNAPSQLTIVTGNPVISNTFADVGLYAEDDWRLRPNMTASYGLRFETQNGIHDHGNWSPRIGFAWGLGKKNAAPKTVIRTGFGIFYDRFGQSLVLNTERLNGINQQQFIIENPSFPTLPSLSALAATPSTTYKIAPTLRAPYTIQAAASVERQVTKNATLSVTYLHSQGDHQFLSINTNALTPGAVPAYEYISEGIFKQNQLITSFNMRAGTKLTIFSFYSLSYANSDTGGAGSFPSNPANIAADYGRAAFDVRHRLFLGGTIALPRGFRVSPFMVANSGAPFNIITGTDLNGDSIFNDRPAFATSSTLAANLQENSFGSFDVAPATGQPRIPMNFGEAPSQFTLNMRLSKTFGLGPKLEAARNGQPEPGGQQGGFGSLGGGRERGGPMGGGRGRGGPGGSMGERSNQRYSLTFSANARNLLNNVNPAPPIGNLSSGRFGQSTALAGGVFNTQSANRRVDFQVMFAF